MSSDRERLHERELLVREAQAVGVSGQQRAVHAGLWTQTRAELADAQRCHHAMDAGWEPFEPAAEWFWGYVEDPRFLRGRVKLASGLAALPVAAAGAAWLALSVAGPGLGWQAGLRGMDMLPAATFGLVLWLGSQAALHGLLGRIAEERDAGLSSRESGVRVFNAPMPARAIVAYRKARASGLFESFTVHSPRAEDFRAVTVSEAPNLGLLDPVLAGHIGRRSFLIAQWDLAADLQV